MNQYLFVKIRDVGPRQLFVANLANRLAKAGPMSEANALGLSFNWLLDLTGPAIRDFNFTPE